MPLACLCVAVGLQEPRSADRGGVVPAVPAPAGTLLACPHERGAGPVAVWAAGTGIFIKVAGRAIKGFSAKLTGLDGALCVLV